jgi:hypothetical protein
MIFGNRNIDINHEPVIHMQERFLTAFSDGCGAPVPVAI